VGRHPLIERASQREVRQSKGFRAEAEKLTGEMLASEYREEQEGAPRRSEAGKKHLVAHNRKLAESRRPGRDAEHAAIALVSYARESGPLPLPEGGSLHPLHAGVHLRAAPVDRARGADDPNRGVERLDLVGLGPADRLTYAVLRYAAPSVTRLGTGDTPLRVLLEGLAHVAIAEADRVPLAEEVAALAGRPPGDTPPALLVLGSPRYWELSRRREAQRGAAWIREMERLARELEEALGVSVAFFGLRLEGDPGWGYESGAPVLAGRPRLVPAWEHGAGRVRPKPKPRRRKESASAADLPVEADLSRPVRPYTSHERYSPGDRVAHPTLGVGVVQGAAGPTKIHVLFDGRKSLLVHDRP
jgi:hypothetical protein